MKRTLALLLASLMLTFPMTACGAGSTAGTTDTTNGTATTSQSAYRTTRNGAMTQYNTTNRTTGGTTNRVITNRPITNRSTYGTTNGTTNRTITARIPNGTTTQQRSVVRGTTYGQMLRNARVHDTDGFLGDGENAVTPGTLY